MNLPWFRRNGMFYIPTTVVGWLILLSGAAYAVYVFIDINNRSHSVSDLFINFIFNLLITIVR